MLCQNRHNGTRPGNIAVSTLATRHLQLATFTGQANWEKMSRVLGQGHTQLSCPYHNALGLSGPAGIETGTT